MAPKSDIENFERSDSSESLDDLSYGSALSSADKPVFSIWYSGLTNKNDDPAQLDFGKYDLIIFENAFLSRSFAVRFEDASTENLLRRLVKAARDSGKGTKIVVELGGWDSDYFSQGFATAKNRQTVINNLKTVASNFDLDGFDIDWQYPPNEKPLPEDSANLLIFLTELRTALGTSKIIGASTEYQPWSGKDGNPLTDVLPYATVLDYVSPRAYRFEITEIGPLSPLGNKCGTSVAPELSVHGSFDAWTKAGFPANKILMGTVFEGAVTESTATEIIGSSVPDRKRSSRSRDLVSSRDALAHKPAKEVEALDEELKDYHGWLVRYNEIVNFGVLVLGEDSKYVGAKGYTRGFDDCSSTPFLYNVAEETFVSYDDDISLGLKANFAVEKGMLGISAYGAWADNGTVLTDAILRGLGK